MAAQGANILPLAPVVGRGPAPSRLVGALKIIKAAELRRPTIGSRSGPGSGRDCDAFASPAPAEEAEPHETGKQHRPGRRLGNCRRRKPAVE
jgi:hypothetical protein